MSANKPVSSYEDVLLSGRWFSSLPFELQQILLKEGTLLSLATGEQLFAQGDSSYDMYAVITGGVSLSRDGKDGKEALLYVVVPPIWFAEASLFDRVSRTHNARAISDTVLVKVSGESLSKILNKEPRYWQNFAQLLIAKLRLFFDQAEGLALRTTSQQLAKRLVLIAESYNESKQRSHRILNLSQTQLATMLFITRQTTQQILKDIEAKGIIKLAYGVIEIIDLDVLRTFADAY